MSSKLLESRRLQLEEAALSLFTSRGFHGVGLRDIAKEAGVSIGNLYNHFENKEALFKGLIERLYADFASASQPLAIYIASANFPDDIAELGMALSEMFLHHADYMTLVYVDVAEFSGVHVRPHYEDLAARFRSVLPTKEGCTVDAGVAFTLVYMQYANYFFVERLVGARGHLGLSDEEAIKTIAHVFLSGLAR